MACAVDAEKAAETVRRKEGEDKDGEEGGLRPAAQGNVGGGAAGAGEGGKRKEKESDWEERRPDPLSKRGRKALMPFSPYIMAVNIAKGDPWSEDNPGGYFMVRPGQSQGLGCSSSSPDHVEITHCGC